jgi:probable HAF family extracellular repeat protein
MHSNTMKIIATGCALSAIACSALAGRPMYEVTCLDCSLASPLLPMAINSSGVVVAIDNASCLFPNGCKVGQGYVIDHGTITMVPSVVNGSGTANTAQAINESNVVVGGNLGSLAFSWDGVNLVSLGDPLFQNAVEGDHLFSYATSINDSGHIVGVASDGYHSLVAFYYENGLMTAVPPLMDSYIGAQWAVRINAKNHISGTASHYADDSRHAWISKKGTTKELAPDSIWSEAYAINDVDQVVGFVREPSTPFGHNVPVIWKKGRAKLLNTLVGYTHGQANAINKAGWVVGDTCGTTACTAFVFNGRKMFDLNAQLNASSTGWTLSHATGVNDAGVIVGTGLLHDVNHAFMATPERRADH